MGHRRREPAALPHPAFSIAFLPGGEEAPEAAAAGHSYTEDLSRLALPYPLPADEEESDPHLCLVSGQQGTVIPPPLFLLQWEKWFRMWVFLTATMFSTAKETLWENEGIGIADPGFRERVEGNGEWQRGFLPTHGSSWVVPAAEKKEPRE
jgi:hypothetical protein